MRYAILVLVFSLNAYAADYDVFGNRLDKPDTTTTADALQALAASLNQHPAPQPQSQTCTTREKVDIYGRTVLVTTCN